MRFHSIFLDETYFPVKVSFYLILVPFWTGFTVWTIWQEVRASWMFEVIFYNIRAPFLLWYIGCQTLDSLIINWQSAISEDDISMIGFVIYFSNGVAFVSSK